jgi:hypothetical protein
MADGPDFSYYKTVNKNQREFHESTAVNKLLIGPVRSGKTYPAIHEALFICGDNPGHEFGVFRNTEKSLEKNIQKDLLEVAFDSGAARPKDWQKSKGILTLWNGCKIIFDILSTSIAQIKGMNMCGWLIDDPDVNRYWDVIRFLYTRLTDPPRKSVKAKYFSTIICANYEGHDQLWQQYMRRRDPGGNGMFAYWFCVTKDNPTLSPVYIEIQKATHSESWMKRYVYGDLEGFVGLVYDEYEPKYHDADLGWCFDDHSLIKFLVIDCGITHPTCVLEMATDLNNIYVYNEWYRVGIRTADLGDYLLQKLNSRQSYKTMLIDPKSHAKEQTSGVSPRMILKDDYGIRGIKIANNSVKPGIEITKGIMTLRDDENNPGKKTTHLFVDPKRCPHLIKELEMLKWKEPVNADFDELAYKEEPVDKDNDATDCLRYGCVGMKKYLKGMKIKEKRKDEETIKRWEERLKKLEVYQNHPDPNSIRADIIKQRRVDIRQKDLIRQAVIDREKRIQAEADRIRAMVDGGKSIEEVLN